MKDQILVNIQIALFFKQILISPDKEWAKLAEMFGSIFENVTPLIIPLPNQPGTEEIPVVQIDSPNGVYRLAIARQRVDLYVTSEGIESFDSKKEVILKLSSLLFNFFSQLIGVKRVALVVKNFVEDEAAATTLAVKLLNNKLISTQKGTAFDTYIRYTTNTTFENFPINNFTTLERSSVFVKDLEEKKGVLITRDFNTVPDQDISAQLNEDTYKNFVLKAGDEINDISKIKNIIWQE